MSTNNYIAKLKLRLDQAIIQRDHWKQLAENRNSIVVTEVCPESRSVEEYIIDADSVRSAWRLIRGYREKIEVLRLQNAMFAAAAANINREREALHAEAEALRAENEKWQRSHRDIYEPALRDAHSYIQELRAELEAARGLLRESREAYTEAIHWEDQQPVMKKIDAFLTATPAPEAPDHIAEASKMV